MAKNNGALALAADYEELEKLSVAENTMAGKRYQRYRNGETIEQIAAADEVKEGTVRQDIIAYEKKFETLVQNAVMRDRLDGELANEKIRKLIRDKLHTKVLKALDHMVTGNKKFVFFDQAKGKIITATAKDWNMMLQAVKEFQKLVSLEQKPAVVGTVVNVNQTNNSIVGQGEDFEERIRRLRKEQEESIAAAKIVDIESNPVEEVEEEKGPEWDF